MEWLYAASILLDRGALVRVASVGICSSVPCNTFTWSTVLRRRRRPLYLFALSGLAGVRGRRKHALPGGLNMVPLLADCCGCDAVQDHLQDPYHVTFATNGVSLPFLPN